jgi:hypothetical protein
MYFPILKSEAIVQTYDRVRLNALDSFGTPDEPAVFKVEIEPEDSVGFFNITSNEYRYLDWSYVTDGEKVVTLKVTTRDNTNPLLPVDVEYTTTLTITVIDETDDYLFSNDNNLRTLEPDILRWIPAEYSSWNHIHRQAQTNILDWLNEIRIVKPDGTAFTKEDIVNKEQVRRLSSLTALRMIFFSLSNQVDDIFDKKAQYYSQLEQQARTRNYIDLDVNGTTTPVAVDLRTVRMVRR